MWLAIALVGGLCQDLPAPQDAPVRSAHPDWGPVISSLFKGVRKPILVYWNEERLSSGKIPGITVRNFKFGAFGQHADAQMYVACQSSTLLDLEHSPFDDHEGAGLVGIFKPKSRGLIHWYRDSNRVRLVHSSGPHDVKPYGPLWKWEEFLNRVLRHHRGVPLVEEDLAASRIASYLLDHFAYLDVKSDWGVFRSNYDPQMPSWFIFANSGKNAGTVIWLLDIIGKGIVCDFALEVHELLYLSEDAAVPTHYVEGYGVPPDYLRKSVVRLLQHDIPQRSDDLWNCFTAGPIVRVADNVNVHFVTPQGTFLRPPSHDPNYIGQQLSEEHSRIKLLGITAVGLGVIIFALVRVRSNSSKPRTLS